MLNFFKLVRLSANERKETINVEINYTLCKVKQ